MCTLLEHLFSSKLIMCRDCPSPKRENKTISKQLTQKNPFKTHLKNSAKA